MSKTQTLLEPSGEPEIEVAPERPPHRAWRVVFSFPVALAILLAVLTVLTVRSRFNDPDLWWHLKTGEIIWNTHSIPRVDVFSFTANGHAWTAQEWLSQVTIYGAWKLGGYTGLMLWLSVLTSLLIIGAYTLCAFYSGNAKVAFLGGMITWFFSTVGLAIRPHILGYVLLICELLILHFGRSRNSRWFLALPPLFAIWINCHSSFFFGLVVLAVVLFCSFLEFRVGLLVAQRWEKSKRVMLSISLALSFGALFINPVGPKLLLYPLDVMLNQHVGVASVSEWQQPNFENARSLAVLGVAGLILLVPLLRRLELRLEELILLALGFGLAVRHERMLFVFGILAAPILCRLLATAWDQYEPERDRPLPNAVVIGVSVLVALLAFPKSHNLEQQVENGNPVKAVEFMRRAGISGRMLNSYEYGGYLIWAAQEHKVFVDGRSDVYDWTGVLGEFENWVTLQTDPKVLLDKYRVDFCLLSRDAPISRVVPLLPGWKLIYADKVSVIFSRSGARQRLYTN